MTQQEGGEDAYLLFGSATLVLWAEEVAREAGIPAEVVPAPVGSKNLCGLALLCRNGQLPALETRLRAEEIPYLLHR